MTDPSLPQDAALATPPLPPLGRAGAYELMIELASGGMATVFLARAVDGRDGSPLVAIKRPHKHLAHDKTFLTMLIDEARLASAIQHENVVRVRELGFDAGIPFIVMDYVEGASLSELRKELSAVGRTVDVKVAVRIALDSLAGLAAAHDLASEDGKPLGIIHRDISPHNIIIGCDGRSFVTDFGIAKAEDRVQTTRTHEVKGKLAYLSPERIDKRRICTVQSDLFSMGVVLWECFAGRRLFRGEDAVDTLQEVINLPIPSLKQIGANVPPALDAVILKALSRELPTRYKTAREFSDAVAAAAGDANTGSRTDVARLMEAIFGPRMALRQEQIGSTIGSLHLRSLLEQSGLPTRDRLASETFGAETIAELAPPAPTERYVPGALGRAGWQRTWRERVRKVPGWLLGSVLGGLIAGALVTVGVLSRRPVAPVVRESIPAALPPVKEPLVRRVVVRLPQKANKIALDDSQRDLDPPADVAAFELPVAAGLRHWASASLVDGTRAEAYVVEQDGTARPESGSFLIRPSGAPESRPTGGGGTTPAPVGTTKNGFTRLK